MTVSFQQTNMFLADDSYFLAQAIASRVQLRGTIRTEEKNKKAQEAIDLVRQALVLYTQMYGAESVKVAGAQSLLADLQDYLNDVDDDENLRLLEKVIVIYGRYEGRSSYNVAIGERKLGIMYLKRAEKGRIAEHFDRLTNNLELAVHHLREAARIFRAINHMDDANSTLEVATENEKRLREIRNMASGSKSGSVTTSMTKYCSVV